MTGAPDRSAYVASKAGVIGLTKTAASEYGERGIRINAIAPGPTMTGAAMKTLNEGIGMNAVIERTALRKHGRPVDIAEATAWLCSPSAAYITGVVLPVDGGWSTS
jgi:NAD(P)-dependent dehydrogenase (short-subunit alcohol dehydrogenase family)